MEITLLIIVIVIILFVIILIYALDCNILKRWIFISRLSKLQNIHLMIINRDSRQIEIEVNPLCKVKAKIYCNDINNLIHELLVRGEKGLGQMYMEGLWSSPTMNEVSSIICSNVLFSGIFQFKTNYKNKISSRPGVSLTNHFDIGTDFKKLIYENKDDDMLKKATSHFPDNYITYNQNITEKNNGILCLDQIQNIGRKQLISFFKKFKENLNEDGIAVFQTLVTTQTQTMFDKNTFASTYINNNIDIPKMDWILKSVKKAGLTVEHIEVFGNHYCSQNYTCWKENLINNKDQIKKKYGSKLYRAYEYYFTLCEAHCKVGNLQLAHIVIKNIFPF